MASRGPQIDGPDQPLAVTDRLALDEEGIAVELDAVAGARVPRRTQCCPIQRAARCGRRCASARGPTFHLGAVTGRGRLEPRANAAYNPRKKTTKTTGDDPGFLFVPTQAE